MQSEEPREKPASVLIQAGADNKPTASQSGSTLSGQPQGMTNNQYVIQETMKNGVATSGMVLSLVGILFMLLGFVTEGLTCLFAWFFGLLGIIFGHIGVARSRHSGVGRTEGTTGYVLGYIVLALYVIPIVLLLILYESW